jgi:hypothetical protein
MLDIDNHNMWDKIFEIQDNTLKSIVPIGNYQDKLHL